MGERKPASAWTRTELLDLYDTATGERCRDEWPDDLEAIAREVRWVIAAPSDAEAVDMISHYGDAARVAARIRRLAGIPDPVAARDALVRAALAWLPARDADTTAHEISAAFVVLVDAIEAAKAAGVTG